MIKRLAAAVSAAMLAALCAVGALGLTGCAPSASLAAFEGTWAVDLGQAARSAGAKELSPGSDMTMTLAVSQDGTATIGALGVEQSGKLAAKSSDEATLEVAGASSEVKLDGGKLLLTHDGATMTFEKQ